MTPLEEIAMGIAVADPENNIRPKRGVFQRLNERAAKYGVEGGFGWHMGWNDFGLALAELVDAMCERMESAIEAKDKPQ